MKEYKIYKSIALLVVVILAGFFIINKPLKYAEPLNVQTIKYVKITGQNIKVDLAITPSEHEQGLSGRPGLKDDEGMLFVFLQVGKHLFWMKDMFFSIDMIWLGADMKVIYIKKDATPASYPTTFGPNQDAKYVLEVISGFSDKNNLKVGDKMEFSY